MLGVYAVKVDRKEKTQRQWWRFLKDFKEMRLGQTWGYGMRVRLSEDMDVCEEECAKGLEEGLGRAEDVGSSQEEEDSNRDGQAYRCGSVTPPLTRETPGRHCMELGNRGWLG